MTLIELLVSISIITLLLSLSLPALRRVSLSAESMKCLAVQRGLGQAFEITAPQRHENWPNLFAEGLDEAMGTTEAGQISFSFGYEFGNSRFWGGTLIGSFWHEGDGAGLWTCPAVEKHGFDLAWGPDQLLTQPLDGAIVSYYYSLALVSEATYWDPRDTSVRESLDGARRLVGIHQTRFPSSKAVLTEMSDFHDPDRIRRASDPQVRSLNMLFADGHAARIRRDQMVDPVPTFDFINFEDGARSYPGLSTPDGYNGRDVLSGNP